MGFSLAKLLLTFKTVYMHIEENFTQDQQVDLQTGKDIATIFEEGKFSQQKEDRNVFKKVLEIIRRNDLAKKF